MLNQSRKCAYNQISTLYTGTAIKEKLQMKSVKNKGDQIKWINNFGGS